MNEVVLFSSASLHDIDDHWNWLSMEASPLIADRFLTAVYETATLLQQFPHIGTSCAVHSSRLNDLRRFPVTLPFGRWLVLYRDSTDGVSILRVLHSAQNWQSLLS